MVFIHGAAFFLPHPCGKLPFHLVKKGLAEKTELAALLLGQPEKGLPDHIGQRQRDGKAEHQDQQLQAFHGRDSSR